METDFQDMEDKEKIIKEARRIEEDLLYSSKGHFYAAQFWSKFHLVVGVLMFANMLVWANRIRTQAKAPAAEYAFEVEIHSIGVSARLGTSSFRLGLPSARLQPGSVEFPRYPLDAAGSDEISGLLALFWRDFWNSLGKDVDSEKLVFTMED